MANTTSSRKQHQRRGNTSGAPAPERIRPLRYKTALRLAFEDALRAIGVHVGEDVRGPVVTTYAWKGSRTA